MLLSKGRRIIEGVATVIGGSEPIALSVSIRPKSASHRVCKERKKNKNEDTQ
jgi:hypothetical protein